MQLGVLNSFNLGLEDNPCCRLHGPWYQRGSSHMTGPTTSNGSQDGIGSVC